MKVTGARLLDTARVHDLVIDESRPLPDHHDAFLVGVFPGTATARVLVVDLVDARAGAALAVCVYPVVRHGAVHVPLDRAGRVRLTVSLAPVFASPGVAWVDIEDGEGEDLWAEEVPVQARGHGLVEELARRLGTATVVSGGLLCGGAHHSNVWLDRTFVVVSFQAELRARVEGRSSQPWLWRRLDWPGALAWAAEDPALAEVDVSPQCRRAFARLPARPGTEVRLAPGESGVSVRLERGDIGEIEPLVRSILEAVALLPPPATARPPDARQTRSRTTTDAAPTDTPPWRVRKARLVTRARAAELANGGDLPEHHDPFIVPEFPGSALPRVLCVDVDSGLLAAVLGARVTSLDGRAIRVDVPARTAGVWPLAGGIDRLQFRIELVLPDGCAVQLEILGASATLWTDTVIADLPRRVLLESIATREPDGWFGSDSTVAVLPDGLRVAIESRLVDRPAGLREPERPARVRERRAQATDPETSFHEWDPLHRLGRKLFGKKFEDLLLEDWEARARQTAEAHPPRSAWVHQLTIWIPEGAVVTAEERTPALLRPLLARLMQSHPVDCQVAPDEVRLTIDLSDPDFPQVENAVAVAREIRGVLRSARQRPPGP